MFLSNVRNIKFKHLYPNLENKRKKKIYKQQIPDRSIVNTEIKYFYYVKLSFNS